MQNTFTLFHNTDRLAIRPLQAQDAESFFQYRSNKEDNLYQGWIPTSKAEADRFIERLPNQFNQIGTWFQCAIVLQESNAIIGDIGIHFMDDQQVEIGCTLAKEYQSKGYAREALYALIQLLFNTYDKHRIIGSVDPQNQASLNLLKALGFRMEAHFRQSIYLRGKWVDDQVFALLQHEWLSQQSVIQKILILCTGNSCRSQMAQGYLASLNSQLYVRSAGTNPSAEIHPKSIASMLDKNLDIRHQKPEHVNRYLNEEWDYVITVCDDAKESCPYFTGKVKHRLHIGFEDPAKVSGSDKHIRSEFNRIRDQIFERMQEFYDKDLTNNN